jgi:hypothetical protein
MVDTVLSHYSTHLQLDYTYSMDSVLSVFATLRVYLLYRGIHYWIGTETATDARMLVGVGEYYRDDNCRCSCW